MEVTISLDFKRKDLGDKMRQLFYSRSSAYAPQKRQQNARRKRLNHDPITPETDKSGSSVNKRPELAKTFIQGRCHA